MSGKPTTVASNAVIALAPMVTATGKLRTVAKKEKGSTGFKMLCPGCLRGDPVGEGPAVAPLATTIHQVMTCDLGHGPYTRDEVPDRGKVVGDNLVALTADEVAAVDGEAPASFTLTVHPAGQVAHLNRTTGIAYAFEPGPGGEQLIGMLRELVARGDRAFFLEGSVKSATRLFRLVAAPHGLELVEMIRPEHIFAFEAAELPYAEKYMPMVEGLVDAMTTDFVEADYADGSAARLAAILAAKEAGTDTVATVTALPKAAPAIDPLEAALIASLEAAQARKAAAA